MIAPDNRFAGFYCVWNHPVNAKNLNAAQGIVKRKIRFKNPCYNGFIRYEPSSRKRMKLEKINIGGSILGHAGIFAH